MAAPWLLIGWLLTFSKSRNAGYFADFEQAKNLTYSKTPLWETGCLSNFLGYLSMSLHPGFSDLWSSPPTAFRCLIFLIVQAFSFLIHLPFPNTVT